VYPHTAQPPFGMRSANAPSSARSASAFTSATDANVGGNLVTDAHASVPAVADAAAVAASVTTAVDCCVPPRATVNAPASTCTASSSVIAAATASSNEHDQVMAAALRKQEQENKFLRRRIQILKDKNAHDLHHGGRGGNDSTSLSTRHALARKTVRSAAKEKVRTEVLDIKSKPPNKDEPTVRIFGPSDHHSWSEEKAYYWCPNHFMWCIHKPAECTIKKESERQIRKIRKKRAGENSNERESL
jgi:hypothetical protein